MTDTKLTNTNTTTTDATSTHVPNTNVTDTSESAPTDPQALASATAHAMWQRDRTAQALAMRIEHIAPGHATLSMPVRS
ncbi:MAG: hypothetical protein KGN40_13405, partial [Burkholderiales bacterium]|nr:hypothetical protein [Burkholderiales bacterium]